MGGSQGQRASRLSAHGSSLEDARRRAAILVLSIRDDDEHSVDLLFSLATQIEDGRDLDRFWETVGQCLAHVTLPPKTSLSGIGVLHRLREGELDEREAVYGGADHRGAQGV